MQETVFSRQRALVVACSLAAGILWSLVAGVPATAAEDRKALLLLPVASGTPGQEWSAKALGGILEDGFGSLRSVRLVSGAARETALRELSAGATVTPEAFQDICRRAGADLAVLGGSTAAEGRLALEIRVFDVGAARELPPFRGDEPQARAFSLVAAAVRHVAAAADLGSAEQLFPRGETASLEAYAAYRVALLEQAPAARIERLREVLKLDADYADPTRRLGVELFREGALDEGLVVLERAVALGPKVAEARNNYGVALAAAGRPDVAQREFEEAVSLSPDYAEARLNLARVFEDRGRTAEAEKQYTAVLEIDAGNDKARAGLAALYDSTGRQELAIKEFRLLSARDPDLAEGEFIRAGQEARKAREYARAEKYFLRATDINPQYAPAWAELGTNSYLAGEYAKGVGYFRKALTIDPGQAAYHYYLGLALDKGRQQDEALREYRRAVELGGPPEARLGLARAALESGDPGVAVEELNRLLAASPDHAEAKALLAQATGEMEARRRLVEGQSQFANQRLARLEQIVADANRANRELEARLQSALQEKRLLEILAPRDRGVDRGGIGEPQQAAVPPPPPSAPGAPPATGAGSPQADGARESARAGDSGHDVERLQGELAAEREARKREGAEAREGLALLRSDKERLEREFAAEQERFKREAERAKADPAAAAAVSGELALKVNEAAELKGQLLAAQGAVTRAEEGRSAERERGERALAAERADRRAEVEKLRADLAAGQLKRQEKERLLQELAAEKSRAAAAQAAREKAEKALAAAAGRGQDRDRLAQELAAERARGLAEQAAREKAERAVAAERERGDQAAAAGREESRRQGALFTARIEALEAQVKTQAETLREREAELASLRARESSVVAESAKSRADLALLAERQAALEARAVAESRTLAEWERSLEKTRLTVRELALELGRNALRTQSWERARGYLEQAAEADPRSGEAWYGLGEALFQLGQYERSKQMYDRARQIY